jgi:hypothetical protein
MSRTPLALDVEQLIDLIADLLEPKAAIAADKCPIRRLNSVLSSEAEVATTTLCSGNVFDDCRA